jgi:hypothetical protein
VSTIYATSLDVTIRFSEDPHLWRRVQGAESSGGSRPEAVLDHIRMHSRQQPFAPNGKVNRMTSPRLASPRCYEATIARIARVLAMLAAVAIWPARAADAPEAAERFTHVSGINLADLPSFDELASRFGVSLVTQSGDAADYEARACYHTLDKKAVLEFFHGEVNWGFVLRTPMRNDLHCLSSAALGGSSISVAGIKLGMRKSAYARLVGESQKGSLNHSENLFQYVRTLTDTELNAMAERGRKSGYPLNDPEELRH